MRANPSRGPQKGRSAPGLAGKERRLQFTDFSAIICITVFRQPARVYDTFFTSPKASLRHSTRLLAPWLSCTWGLAVTVAVCPGVSDHVEEEEEEVHLCVRARATSPWQGPATTRPLPETKVLREVSLLMIPQIANCKSPGAGLRRGQLSTSPCPREPHDGQDPTSSPELC